MSAKFIVGSRINPGYPLFKKKKSQNDGSNLYIYILPVILCIVPALSICYFDIPNQLSLINIVFVHYRDAENVFQVLWSRKK